jgi:DNA polymerase-3 subunit alpha
LTLDKPEDTVENGPESIIKICEEEGLKDVYLCDSNMSGFVSAYKNTSAAKQDLHFGLKLVICNNMQEKTFESKQTESKVILWMRNSDAYADLIKIYSIAATEGFYERPRIDTATLREYWNERNLMLSIPYYYSFLHRNLLYGSNCLPDFSFSKPFLHQENNRLPFNYLINGALEKYATASKLDIVPSKSIYYRRKKDFIYYMAYKCIHERTNLEMPEVEHMASDEFCLESWREENE